MSDWLFHGSVHFLDGHVVEFYSQGHRYGPPAAARVASDARAAHLALPDAERVEQFDFEFLGRYLAVSKLPPNSNDEAAA